MTGYIPFIELTSVTDKLESAPWKTGLHNVSSYFVYKLILNREHHFASVDKPTNHEQTNLHDNESSTR